jgi:hypothetical protein
MRIFAGQKMTEAGYFLLHDAAEHLFRGIATLLQESRCSSLAICEDDPWSHGARSS